MNTALDRNRVLLGVTGSIAAYKSAELARLLVKRGYEVRVAMTESAQQFISPLTFESLTGNAVSTGFWDSGDSKGDIEHIALADRVDIIVVAPATADFIAKAAHGMADNALLAMLLASKAPVLLAPAMNVNMFLHARTQANIETLRNSGVSVIDPEEGDLACGWQGAGRMASPWEIFYHAQRGLSAGDLTGKKVVIAAGPTREAIDPVRFISNRSSGKMGLALAREAFRRGAEVTLVHGPISAKVAGPIHKVPVVSASEMRDAMLSHCFPENEEKAADIIIMTAAVADFKPGSSGDKKLKKSEMPASLQLEKNPDILSELGERRGDSKRPLLIGFAVETGETEELLEEATRKMRDKNADMIVGNFAEDALELDTNRAWIINRHGKRDEIATTFKSRVAQQIFNSIVKL